MAILEAWSFGKPVLMSKECNLPDGFSREAALNCGHSMASLDAALYQLIEATTAELESMGDRGRRLVISDFAWPSIADRFSRVYSSLHKNKNIPADLDF